MNFTDDDNGINNDMSRWMDKRVYQLEMKSGAAPRSATVSWPSFSVTGFFPISKFSYKLIRFLLHSPEVKSDNEIPRKVLPQIIPAFYKVSHIKV